MTQNFVRVSETMVHNAVGDITSFTNDSGTLQYKILQIANHFKRNCRAAFKAIVNFHIQFDCREKLPIIYFLD